MFKLDFRNSFQWLGAELASNFQILTEHRFGNTFFQHLWNRKSSFVKAMAWPLCTAFQILKHSLDMCLQNHWPRLWRVFSLWLEGFYVLEVLYFRDWTIHCSFVPWPFLALDFPWLNKGFTGQVRCRALLRCRLWWVFLHQNRLPLGEITSCMVAKHSRSYIPL